MLEPSEPKWKFSNKLRPSPDALTSISRAMEKLLSPAANSFTQDLLNTAVARHHGRPVLFMVVDDDSTATSGGDNTVLINSRMKYPVADAEGHLRYLTLEQVIAHELAHAGQNADWDLRSDAVLAREEAKHNVASMRTDDEKAQRAKLIQAIENAPDYQSAATLVKKLVEVYEFPDTLLVTQKLRANNRYTDYIQQVEMPAVEAEWRVAELLGSGDKRVAYSVFELPKDHMRQFLTEFWEIAMDIDRKPGAPDEKASWQDQVDGKVPEKKSHPRISTERGRAKGME